MRSTVSLLLLTAAPLPASALPGSSRVLHPSSLDASIVADLTDEGRLLSEGRRELARAKLEHALDTLRQIRTADFEQESARAAPPRAAAAAAAADFEALRTSVLDALTHARKEPSLLHETNQILRPHKALLSSIAAHKDGGGAAPSAEALAGLRQLQSELRPIQQRVAALGLERKEGARAPALRAPARRAAAPAAAPRRATAPAQNIEREREREFDTLRTDIRARLTLLRRADTAASSEAEADALETARGAAAEWVLQHRTLLDGLESKRRTREAPSEAEMTSLREMASSMEQVTAALPRSLERQIGGVKLQMGAQGASVVAAATAAAADTKKVEEASAAFPISDEARAVEALKAKYDAAAAGAADAAEAPVVPSLEALPTNADASSSAASSSLRGEAAEAAQTLASAAAELATEEEAPPAHPDSALARAVGAANGHTLVAPKGVSAERQAPQLPQFEHAGVAARVAARAATGAAATERDAAALHLRGVAQSLLDEEQTPPAPAHAAAAATTSDADVASEQAAAPAEAIAAASSAEGAAAEAAEPAAEGPTAAARTAAWQLKGLAASLDEIA